MSRSGLTDATVRPTSEWSRFPINGSMIAAEDACTVVGERRIAFGVQAGASDLERASHFRPGDLIEQEHLPGFLAGHEIGFEPEPIVVNQHGIRSGNRSRKDLIACVDERALHEIEDGRHMVEDPSVHVAIEIAQSGLPTTFVPYPH